MKTATIILMGFSLLVAAGCDHETRVVVHKHYDVENHKPHHPHPEYKLHSRSEYLSSSEFSNVKVAVQMVEHQAPKLAVLLDIVDLRLDAVHLEFERGWRNLHHNNATFSFAIIDAEYELLYRLYHHIDHHYGQIRTRQHNRHAKQLARIERARERIQKLRRQNRKLRRELEAKKKEAQRLAKTRKRLKKKLVRTKPGPTVIKKIVTRTPRKNNKRVIVTTRTKPKDKTKIRKRTEQIRRKTVFNNKGQKTKRIVAKERNQEREKKLKTKKNLTHPGNRKNPPVIVKKVKTKKEIKVNSKPGNKKQIIVTKKEKKIIRKKVGEKTVVQKKSERKTARRIAKENKSKQKRKTFKVVKRKTKAEKSQTVAIKKIKKTKNPKNERKTKKLAAKERKTKNSAQQIAIELDD